MGIIYHFNALQVPFLEDMISAGNFTQDYNSLSANMKSNVDYVRNNALLVSSDNLSDDTWNTYRYSLVADLDCGCYISGNYLYWEFIQEVGAINCQMNIHVNGMVHVWTNIPSSGEYNSYNNLYIDAYSTKEDLLRDLYRIYPITYRLTNCTAPSAPTKATVGDTVTVPFQFTSGYGIVNPASDVYVTNNGVIVPSQYSNGVLTFTMPDPS